jgi:hypothetical protein
MVRSTIVAGTLRIGRAFLGLSHSRLARLSGVSRFKICTFKRGDGTLADEEQTQDRHALEGDAERLQRATNQTRVLDFLSGAAQDSERTDRLSGPDQVEAKPEGPEQEHQS